MTRDELLERLGDLGENDGDPERAHQLADVALLDFIDDRYVTAAFHAIERWYA